MAKLYVTEYPMMGIDFGKGMLPPADRGVDQVVTFTTTTQSTVFAATTRVIRVHTDGICSIAFGANPTATTSNARMNAGDTEYFAVKPGDKIAAVTNT